jgi:hypothetical protein
LTTRALVRNGLAINSFEQQNRSKQGKNNTVSRRLLSALDFFIFLLREKTRVQVKRGSLRWFVLFGSGLPINLEEAVKKSSPEKC